jgi:hypothetical protein
VDSKVRTLRGGLLQKLRDARSDEPRGRQDARATLMPHATVVVVDKNPAVKVRRGDPRMIGLY